MHFPLFLTVWYRITLSTTLTKIQKGKNKDEPDRMLLDDVWGEVPEQQTTASKSFADCNCYGSIVTTEYFTSF